MKTLRGLIIVAFLISGISPAYPVDVSLGATAWYVKWTPDFKNKFRGEDNAITSSAPAIMSGAYNDRFDSDPVFMGGPVLNLKLSERWSLGLVAIMSQEYTIASSFQVYESATPDTYTARYNFTFRRYDSDLTANYRINSWLGVFGGVKYLRWGGTGDVDVTTGLGTYSSHSDSEVDGQALGPALGLSLSVPLISTLYLTGSASLLYLTSKEKMKQSVTDTINPPSTGSSDDSSVYHGFNGMAGLGCYVIPLRTTLIVGARYQFLQKGNDPRDVFSGVTATAVYSF